MTGQDPGSTGPDEGAQDTAAWRAEGFTDDEAAGFRRWRFSLAQATAWRRAGVLDGLRAAQWVTSGVTPETVNTWRAAGIDASQAVHWHEMGFGLAEAKDALRRGLTPDSAFAARHHGPFGSGGAAVLRSAPGAGLGRGDVMRRLRQAGVGPDLIHGYLNGTWEVEEALVWAQAGVAAADAAVWQGLGLTAAEAGRLTRKGATAVETMRAWWQAGIPFDEVADWIGAGLSPQEAAGQRARGITAEQAAALRALRDEGVEE
jgi:hypothetical protein